MALAIGILAIIVHIHETIAKSPRHSGENGERYMSRELHKLDPHHYTTINNMCLPSSGNTEITQIDHIVISTYGIFIIETKSHRGYIFGSAKGKYWTQVLGYHNKYQLYNPIRQNYAHERALENLLGEKLKTPPVALVAFPMATELKIDAHDKVGRPLHIIDKIRSHTHETYSFAERTSIFEAIVAANIVDKEILERHKDEVRELHEAVVS